MDVDEEEDSVFVTCNGETHKFVVEDLEPDFLKATFGLSEAPTTLFSLSSNLAIPIAKKARRLKRGESYYIKGKAKSFNVGFEECDSLATNKEGAGFLGDCNEGILLNALIASTAIYYPTDDKCHGEGGECEKYLTEQLDNHNLEYIVRNRFGANHYLLAKVMQRYKYNKRCCDTAIRSFQCYENNVNS